MKVVHIAIVTDTWAPQVNGVVTALQALVSTSAEYGCKISVFSFDRFASLPIPTYPELRLVLARPAQIGRLIAESGADHVHIATEGTLGWAARSWCKRAGRNFTTSFHTRFPEYLAERLPLPMSWSYSVLRKFHNAGRGVMVTTMTMQNELQAHGFNNVMLAPLGVDLSRFRLGNKDFLDLPRPIFLYVGRLAVEKNLHAFLKLELPGSKVIVGDGPARAEFEAQYPDVHFMGMKPHAETALYYGCADVFVFPSITDTFGVVMLEAMACGLPVAAFPVPGPNDVVGEGGVLDTDLRAACFRALDVPAARAIEQAQRFTQKASTERFIENIRMVSAPMNIESPARSSKPRALITRFSRSFRSLRRR